MDTRTTADIYSRKGNTTELQRIGSGQVTPLQTNQEVRVILRSQDNKTGFNPPHPVSPLSTVWLSHPHKVKDLDWDPAEWIWKANNHIQTAPFYSYNTKHGYRQGTRSILKPTKYEQRLQAKGYTDSEWKHTHLHLWHQWLPRKVSSFLWLMHNEGLPIGSWLATMKIDGACKICTTSPTETARH